MRVINVKQSLRLLLPLMILLLIFIGTTALASAEDSVGDNQVKIKITTTNPDVDLDKCSFHTIDLIHERLVDLEADKTEDYCWVAELEFSDSNYWFGGVYFDAACTQRIPEDNYANVCKKGTLGVIYTEAGLVFRRASTDTSWKDLGIGGQTYYVRVIKSSTVSFTNDSNGEKGVLMEAGMSGARPYGYTYKGDIYSSSNEYPTYYAVANSGYYFTEWTRQEEGGSEEHFSYDPYMHKNTDNTIDGRDVEKSVAYVAHFSDTCIHKLATTKVEGVAATCTSDGILEHWKCQTCGQLALDEDFTELTDESGIIIYKPVLSLSHTSYTYNGNVKSPILYVKDTQGNTISSDNYTVTKSNGRKNVGTYSYTINFKGKYSGSKTVYFRVNPKGTYISKLTAYKSAFTVKWNKQSSKMASSRITGYQIQYSTSSKFTSAKTVTVKGYSSTSKKISKLKAKKKYYVRVRTYKKINDKTYYSSWSKAKYIKTK